MQDSGKVDGYGSISSVVNAMYSIALFSKVGGYKKTIGKSQFLLYSLGKPFPDKKKMMVQIYSRLIIFG